MVAATRPVLSEWDHARHGPRGAGGGGIGRALCRAIAAQGSMVAVADLDGDRAAAVAAELNGLGVVIDVTDPDSVHAAVDEVTDRLGPVTGLVNNAGVDVVGRFVDSTPRPGTA